jgi:hypothetical protein
MVGSVLFACVWVGVLSWCIGSTEKSWRVRSLGFSGSLKKSAQTHWKFQRSNSLSQDSLGELKIYEGIVQDEQSLHFCKKRERVYESSNFKLL